MSDRFDELGRELGASPPASFAMLEPREIEALTAALAAARESQRVALEQAIESGLGSVPRLLRGPVKRVLFG